MQTSEELRNHWIDFIGSYTWEEICLEWVLTASAQDKLPFLPDQVGSAWTRKAQVDMVGINSMKKTLLLGECKWSSQVMGRTVLRDLVDKTAEIVPPEGRWTVYYLGFARSGWTPESQQLAGELAGRCLEGVNWQASGMRLLDLKQVDLDLADWTA